MVEKADAGERRLTMLLMSYWEQLRQSGPHVPAEAFQPGAMIDIWDRCFILVRDGKAGAGAFEHLGDLIAVSSGISPESRNAAEVPEGTLLAKAMSLAPEVFEGNFPLLDSGEFTDWRGRSNRYRLLLVPLCDDKGAVVKLVGGGSHKVAS